MNPRRLRILLLCAAATVLSIWRAEAQTLADAARKATEPAPEAKASSRSFSNRDLKASSPADDGVIATPHAEAEAATPPGPVLSREEIVNRIMPAVVTIQAGNGTGTGFFVDRGLVMTNHHVVGDTNVVRLRMSNGTIANGTVWRRASDADLALVKVENPNAATATVTPGSYRHLQAGEEVLVIGSSLGVLQNTVTRGIVSAVRRSGGVVYVQTDAAINPGNSGGPLVDKYGRVVGINTARIRGAEALGFSIAIDHGRRLIAGQTFVADRGAPDATRAENGSKDFAHPRALESEERRHAGVAAYDAEVRTLAEQANDVDEIWREYTTLCGIGAPAAPAGGRAWFAVWSSAGAAGGSARRGCADMRNVIIERVNRVKGGMAEASERARRAGVHPGQAREVRRRYSLDSDVW